MCYYGAYFGYLSKGKPLPCKVNRTVRPIPEKSCTQSTLFYCLFFGLIQFVSIYVEFMYLVDSVFRHHIYAMFGFLLLNLVMHAVIISLLSIISTYKQLSSGDHCWWWRSFLVGASSTIYISISFFTIMVL